MLRKFADPQLSLVVRTYYNVYLDPPARDLPLGERLKALHAREGARFSPRTTKRLFDTYLAELVVSLGQNYTAVSSHLLQGILAKERAHPSPQVLPEARWPVPEDTGRHAQRFDDRAEVVSPKVRRFLATEVYGLGPGPDSARGGTWLCVFASVDRLAAYQHANHTPWRGEHWTKTGAEVVREVIRHQPPVGILVNPVVRSGEISAESLRLPPSVLGELASTL